MKSAISIQSVNDIEKRKWNTVVHHPLQKWEWGVFRQSMGNDIARLGVYDNDILTDGWQISFHKIPHTPFTVGYFPKGPEITSFMVSKLSKLGKQKRAIFIQIEPNIEISKRQRIKTSKNIQISHHPLFTKYTFILDLTKSEEALLKSFHPKTRYNIRLAEKHGVIVKEDNSEEAFREYLRLTVETTGRQKFYAHNAAYHRAMWQKMSKAGIAHLFTAKYEGSVVCAWIVFIFQNTIYYPYGASSRLHRDVMAPNLMMWEIIRWAKKRNIKYFDLWGALGPAADSDNPWYGFHRFKEGYKPRLVEYIGSYNFIIRPTLYRVYAIADTIRWFLLNRIRFS